jgi:hypothetical protein
MEVFVATAHGLAVPRQQLEDEWLARVKDAEAAWLRARQDYKLARQNGLAIDRLPEHGQINIEVRPVELGRVPNRAQAPGRTHAQAGERGPLLGSESRTGITKARTRR